MDILHGATATATSSAFSIGGAVWSVVCAGAKVVHLTAASMARARHPLPLALEPLGQPDVCLVSGLARNPTVSANKMVQELCTLVGAGVAGNGNVLLPVHSAGVLFDLVEIVQNHLAAIKCGTVPIYVVSPTAKAAFGFANIFSSW
jgi:Cft2 family RNA processing exonuclease